MSEWTIESAVDDAKNWGIFTDSFRWLVAQAGELAKEQARLAWWIEHRAIIQDGAIVWFWSADYGAFAEEYTEITDEEAESAREAVDRILTREAVKGGAG